MQIDNEWLGISSVIHSTMQWVGCRVPGIPRSDRTEMTTSFHTTGINHELLSDSPLSSKWFLMSTNVAPLLTARAYSFPVVI